MRLQRIQGFCSVSSRQQFAVGCALRYLIVLYVGHAEGYDVKNGKPTREVCRIKVVLQFP